MALFWKAPSPYVCVSEY